MYQAFVESIQEKLYSLSRHLGFLLRNCEVWKLLFAVNSQLIIVTVLERERERG